VRIPDEGRMMTVPKDKVSADTVTINKDPFYRSDLRAKYDRIHEAGGAPPPDGRVFEGGNVATKTDAKVDSLLGEGSAVSVAPGVTRQQIEQKLSQVGYTFKPGQEVGGYPSVVGVAPGGAGKMTLIGPATQVYGIILEARGPEGMINMITTQMIQMSGPASEQVQALLTEAKSKGRANKSMMGLNATISYQRTGQNVSFMYKIMGF
jgi:hypothetical protein